MGEQKNTENKPFRFSGMAWSIALGVFLLDQGTKELINRLCDGGWRCQIIPGFFHLVNIRNTGAAWGMFGEHTWLLALFSLVVFLCIFFYFRKWSQGEFWTGIALALLEGGILGNMVDRIFRHSVIDFLDFHIAGVHWPAFNVADSAICIAVGLLFWGSLRGKSGQKVVE